MILCEAPASVVIKLPQKASWYPLPVIVQLLAELKPDACIVTTMSLLSDLKDALLTCAKCGVNAITTCEEAFYPFNSSPRITM